MWTLHENVVLLLLTELDLVIILSGAVLICGFDINKGGKIYGMYC